MHQLNRVENSIKAMAVLDRNSASRSFDRRLFEEKREASIEIALSKAREGAEMLDFYIKQEEQIAYELEQVRLEKIKKEKIRQQIRENNEELRVMETKLRAAYVGKEIRAQIAEKEARLIEEKVSDSFQ